MNRSRPCWTFCGRRSATRRDSCPGDRPSGAGEIVEAPVADEARRVRGRGVMDGPARGWESQRRGGVFYRQPDMGALLENVWTVDCRPACRTPYMATGGRGGYQPPGDSTMMMAGSSHPSFLFIKIKETGLRLAPAGGRFYGGLPLGGCRGGNLPPGKCVPLGAGNLPVTGNVLRPPFSFQSC